MYFKGLLTDVLWPTPEPHSSPISSSPEESKDFRKSMQWRIFRIMAELLDGWQFLADFRNSIAVFGSGSIKSDHPWCVQAETFGKLVTEAGFDLLTEGGPGIMEAANKGALAAKSAKAGQSLGINIKEKNIIRSNPYVKKSIAFHYFFVRSLMMSYSARAYVYFPGGLGTLDHLTALITLIQTKKTQRLPIILVGKEFWSPITDYWVKEVMYGIFEAIDEADMNIYTVVDTPEEAFALINNAPEREGI